MKFKFIFVMSVMLIGLPSMIQAEDHSSFNVGYSDWDFDGANGDSLDLGFESVSGNIRWGVGAAVADIDYVGDVNVYSIGADYGFGDWGAGTPYVGLFYGDSDLADGDVYYTVGYGKSSATEVNFDFSVTDCSDCYDNSVNFNISWPVGGGNFIGIGYGTELTSVADDIDVISINYSRKW